TSSLQLLLAAFVDAHGFSPDHEVTEAEMLWEAASRDGPRLRPPFDRAWFDNLLAHERMAAPWTPCLGRPDEDESEETKNFFGRVGITCPSQVNWSAAPPS